MPRAVAKPPTAARMSGQPIAASRRHSKPSRASAVGAGMPSLRERAMGAQMGHRIERVAA